MKAKKAKIKKKGETRYREWERKRRDRLNVSFLELYSSLPDYDPAVNRSKVDIITHATSHIKDLNGKIQQLMEKSDCNSLYVSEITQLKKKITDLTMRCRQLADLLKKFNVPLPSDLPPECFVSALKEQKRKWTNQIKPEMVNEFLKIIKKNKENKKSIEKETENTTSSKSSEVKKSKNKDATSKLVKISIPSSVSSASSSSLVSNTCNKSSRNNNSTVVSSNTSSILASTTSTLASMPLRELNRPSTVPNKTKNVKLVATANTTPSIKSLVTSTSKSMSVVLSDQLPKTALVTVTKSNLLSTPIMATGIQNLPAVINRNPALQNLGPGTLILPDGRIVNVPPPAPAPSAVIAAATTQFIVNRPVNPPSAVIVIPNSNVTSVVNNKNITTNVANINDKVMQKGFISNAKMIVPKPPSQNKKETTKTTYANKVPIPALSSHRHNAIMNFKSVKNLKQATVKNIQNINVKNNKNIKNNTGSNVIKVLKNVPNKKILSYDKQKCNQNLKVSEKINDNVISAGILESVSDTISTIDSITVSTSSVCTAVDVKQTTIDVTNFSCNIESKNENEKKIPVENKEKFLPLKDPSYSAITNNKRPYDSIDDDNADHQTTKKLKTMPDKHDKNISETPVIQNKENNTVKNEQENPKNSDNILSDVMLASASKMPNNCEKYSIDALCCKNNSKNNLNKDNIEGTANKSDSCVQNDNFNVGSNDISEGNAGVNKKVNNSVSEIDVSIKNVIKEMNLCTSDITPPSAPVECKEPRETFVSTKVSVGNGSDEKDGAKKLVFKYGEKENEFKTQCERLPVNNQCKNEKESLVISHEPNITQQINDMKKKQHCENLLNDSSADNNNVASSTKMDLPFLSTVTTSVIPVSSTMISTNTNKNSSNNTYVRKQTTSELCSIKIPVDKTAETHCKQTKFVTKDIVSNKNNDNMISGTCNIIKGPENDGNISGKIGSHNFIHSENHLSNNNKSIAGYINSALPNLNYHLDNGRHQNILTSVINCSSHVNAPTVKTHQTSSDVQPMNQLNKEKNVFMPIANNHHHHLQNSCMDDVRLSIPNSEFSNDLFTSLQVPSGSQHPESLSPTAAFLLAFPLVSTSKTSEMLADNENSDSQHATPTTILQIGNIEPPNNDLYHNTAAVASSASMIVDSNIASSSSNNNNNNSEFNDIKIEHSHQSERSSNQNDNGNRSEKLNEISKIKNIQSHKNPSNYHSTTSMISFEHNTHLGLDNNYLPVSTSNVCYTETNNSNNNFNRNNISTYSKSNVDNYVNIRNVNKNTDKLHHQPNQCVSNTSNLHTHEDSFMISCSEKKKSNSNNNVVNHRNTVYDTFNLQTAVANSENHYHDKLFDHRNVQFSSSNSIPSRQQVNLNNPPMSSSSLGSSAGCNNVSNKKICTITTSQTDIIPSCTYTQAITSASSVSLASSQSYSYNLFSNCNDFSLNTSSHLAYSNTSNTRQQSSGDVKCSSSNLNIFPPWSSNNICTSNYGCHTTTFSTTYPVMSTSTQKSCSTQTTTLKSTTQNNLIGGNTFDNNNLKAEKNSLNPLPKFSTNFNFTSGNHMLGHQDVYNCQSIPTAEVYKNEKPAKKSSSKITSAAAQPRPPVNWMTTPDLRPTLHDVPSSLVPDMMFLTSQKEIDFATSNMNNCNNLPPFSIANNTQPFYGLDIPLDIPGQLPEIPNTLNKSSHRTTSSAANSTNQQASSHHYSWSPSKSSIPLLSHLDSHSLMIPSTLPTLVGDLALGTNTGPSTPATDSNIRSFNIPPPAIPLHSYDDKLNRYNHNKSRHENTTLNHHSQSVQNQKSKDNSNNNNIHMKDAKDCIANTNSRNNSSRITHINNSVNSTAEFCNNNNTNKTSHQTHQSTNTSGSFLSVSQLVDQVKSEGRNVTTRRVNKSQQSSNNANSNNKQNAINNVGVQKSNSSNISSLSLQDENKTQQNVKVGTNHSQNNFNSNRKLYPDNNNRHNYTVSTFSSGGNQNVPESVTQWHHHDGGSSTNKIPSSYKGGNYSAESLIGMNHDHHDSIPTFASSSAVHQFGHHHHHHRMNHNANHGYNHQVQKPFGTVETPVLPVGSSSSSVINSSNCMTTNIINPDFHTLSNNMVQPHSVVGNVDFATSNTLGQNVSSQQQTPSYQNCFNFTASTQNSGPTFTATNHSVSVPFITDNDCQIGCLDTSYLFTHPTPGPPSLSHSTANVTSTFSTITSSASTISAPISLSTPIISSAPSIGLPINRNCHTSLNQSTSNINKLTTSTSMNNIIHNSSSNNNNRNKTNRKRKDNDNFSLVPPTSLSISSTIPSSSTPSIYTSTYLHPSHVNYSNSLGNNVLPSTRGINNYQSTLSSTVATTTTSSCLSISGAVNQSTTTLTNFNLSTIFPEINDKQQRNAQGHSSNFLIRDVSKHLDIGSGNPSIRNPPDYLPPLCAEFNNVIPPPQIGAQLNPPLPPHFPSDSFIAPSTFTSSQQDQ